MNLAEWKAACEAHAGHTIKWTDIRDTWWGMTAWGEDGTGIYSIIPAITPQCVIIVGQRQEVLSPAPVEQPALL